MEARAAVTRVFAGLPLAQINTLATRLGAGGRCRSGRRATLAGVGWSIPHARPGADLHPGRGGARAGHAKGNAAAAPIAGPAPVEARKNRVEASPGLPDLGLAVAVVAFAAQCGFRHARITADGETLARLWRRTVAAPGGPRCGGSAGYAPDPDRALPMAQASLGRLVDREALTIAFDEVFRIVTWMFGVVLLTVPFCPVPKANASIFPA